MKKEVLKSKEKYDFTPDEKIFYDTIIIGAGIVGFAAAMYSGRLGLKTLIIGKTIGGTIILTHIVENYPGFISISGQELAKRIESHARDYNIDILNTMVKKVEMHKKKKERYFKIYTPDKSFSTKTIIFAIGTKLKRLNVPGEREYENKGLSYCALCDGPLFKNKVVGVVGGSDSAVKEALLLTEYAKKVFIIYRKEKLHPEPINMQRAKEKIKQGKLEIINNTNIKEIKGKQFVTHVILDKPYKGRNEFKLDGLFIEIGRVPLSNLAKNIGAKINKKGEIIVNKNSETNVEGVYAAGDVTDTEFKQAIIGVGEGVAAAYHAYECAKKGECIVPSGEREINKNGKRNKRG